MVEHPLRQIRNRLLWFFISFILISGLVGSWIVGTDLLFSAGFWIYGNIGKLVLLLLIFFGLQIRKKLDAIDVVKRGKLDNALVVLSVLLLPLFFFFSYFILIDLSTNDLGVIILSHLLILTSGASLFLGIFGVKTVKNFIKTFSKEVKTCLLLLPILYIGIFEVWKLWPFFSGGVLSAVNGLLSLTFKTRIIQPYTIYVNTFGIEVAQACSGLDSLFMFSMLYLLVIGSEWGSIDKKRAIMAFVPLAIGLYLINILRVYLLVVIGAVWSPYIAVHLFHTYASMILFLLYFLAFFKWGYGWLRKN